MSSHWRIFREAAYFSFYLKLFRLTSIDLLIWYSSFHYVKTSNHSLEVNRFFIIASK